jgi:hypothetical protein
MRFKKLITPLLITVTICATLALGYQQDPLRRGLTNPFSGAGQTQKRDDQSADVKELYSRITNLESKVSSLEERIEGLQKPRFVVRVFSVEYHGSQPLIWR